MQGIANQIARHIKGPMALLIVFAFVFAGATASAQQAPVAMNISGGLFYPTGNPILNTSVDFKLEVYDKDAKCVLYSEFHLGEDLSETRGGFSLVLGDGTSKTNNVSGTTALDTSVFANSGSQTVAGCADPVNLAAGDERVLRVYYNVGNGYVSMTPDIPIVGAAYSSIANTLQGKVPANFVQVRDDATTKLNQANAEYAFSATNWPKLQSLLDGGSSQYISTTPGAPVDFNSQRLTNVQGPSADSDAATKGYSDANIGGKLVDLTNVGPGSGNGQTIIWDQAQNKWVAGTPVGIDPTRLSLAGGTMTGSIDMGGNDLLNVGNMVMGPKKLLSLGTFDDTEEADLITSLSEANAGMTWYNKTMKVYKIWDGNKAVTQLYLDGSTGWISPSWIPDTSVTSGTYGSPNSVPVFTVGTDGRLIAASTVTIEGVAPGGAAGGVLAGTYPNPSLADGVIINQKIADDAVTSAKLNSTAANFGVNRLVATDPINGSTLSYFSCNIGEIMKWSPTGWTCDTVTSLAPVTSVAGKLGAVTLNAADIGGLGTASLRDHGTASGEIPLLNSNAQIALADGTASNPSFSFAGSSDTGIYSPGSNALALATAGNPIVTITNDGYVGIGTTTPRAGLDIGFTGDRSALLLPADSTANRPTTVYNGMIRYNNTNQTVEGYVGGEWQNFAIGAGVGSVQSVTLGSGLVAGTITARGTINVDVGNTANKVVRENSDAQIVQLSGAASAPSYSFDNDTDTGFYSPIDNTVTLATAGTAALTVNGSQFVGIGTTIPQAGLDISTTGDGSAIIIPRDSTANRPPSINGMIRYNTDNNAVEGYVGGQWLNFAVGPTVGTVQLVDTGNGLLGGPVTAQGTLSVDTGSAANKIVQLNNDAQTSLRDGTAALPTYSFANSPATGLFSPGANKLALAAQGTAALTVTGSNGFVGVGVSAPTNKFEVAGSVAVGSYAGAGSAPVNGLVVSGLVGVGTNAPQAALDVATTGSSSAIIVPRDSTANRPSSVEGMIRYNTDSHAVEGFVNGQWQDFAVGPLVGTVQAVNTGNGLLGGPITAIGTLAVDTGTAANKVVQLNANAQSALANGSAALPTYSFALSPNTGVFSPAVNNLALAANGTTSLIITGSNGHIGVGIGSPANSLDVLGSVAMGTYAGMAAPTNSLIVGGTVGIGTQTPGTKLHIASSTNSASNLATDFRLSRATTSQPVPGFGSVIQVQLDNADNQQISATEFGGVWHDPTTAFEKGAFVVRTTNNGTMAERVRVTNIGLGIGTNNPRAALEIASAGTSNSAIILPRDTTANRPDGVNGMMRYNTTSQTMEGYVADTWQTFAIGNGVGTVREVTAGTGLSGGTITWNGTLNVDVGTAANKIPQLSSTAQMALSNGQLVLPTYTFADSINTGMYSPASNTLALVSQGTASLTLTGSNGFIGIGTTNPTTVLDVVGVGPGSAILIPRDTELNRPNGQNGMIRYNTTANTVEGYIAGTWQNFAIGAGVGTVQVVAAGNGLLGGTISTKGTLAVDTGTAAHQLVQLNVDSQAALSNGTALTPAYSFANSSSTGLFSPSVNNLSLAAAGTTALTITGANTNIGIGYTTPANKLDINGSMALGSFVGIAAPTNGLIVSGNVGIGTSTPEHNLSVSSSDPTIYTPASNSLISPTHLALSTPTINVFNPSLTNGSGAFLELSANDAGARNNLAYIGAVSASGVYSPNIVIGQRTAATSYQERMRIDANGFVGIGTSTPQAAFEVVGLGTAASAIIVPRDSETNRPVAGVNGMIRYNTTANAVEGYVNGQWQKFAVGALVGTVQQVDTGNGLLGGPITGMGTLRVDTGITGNKIVQLNGSAQAALSDGSAAIPTFTFANSPSTGMFSAASDTLSFSALGSTAMTIKGGNRFVGIGTTSPGLLLHVQGTSAVSSDASTYQAKVSDSSRSLSFGVSTTTTEIESSGSLPIILSPTGNKVGVGTTAPARNLEVHSALGQPMARLSSGTDSGYLEFDGGSSGSDSAQAVTTRPTFKVFTGTSVEGFRVNTVSNGANYVSVTPAIAGSSPSVNAAGADASIDLKLNAKGTGNVLVPTGNVSVQAGNILVPSGMLGVGTSSPSVPLHTIGTVAHMSGNVGIGTVSPQAGLDVATTGTSSSAILVPRDSLANRPSGVNGMIRYNTNNNAMEGYINGQWQDFAVGTLVGSVQYVGTGNGLLGGPITGLGTIRVDTGTGANQLVQLNASAQSALANGSVSTPTYSFTNSSSTGIYSPSANNITVAAAGTATLSITGSNGYVGIGNSSPAYNLDVTGTINSTGDISTAGNITTTANIHQTATGAAASPQVNVTTISNSGSAEKFVTRARGTSVATTGAVSDADVIEKSTYRAHNGTQYEDVAYIKTSVDGTNVTGSLNHPGGRIDFVTRSSSDTTATSLTNSSLTIRNGGLIGIGTSAPQAALDIVGTGASASAMIVPRDTSANRPSGVNGMIRYNTNISSLEGYVNGSWQSVAVGSAVGTVQSLTIGSGMTANGSTITSSGTIAVDVGTAANKVVQLNATAQSALANGYVGFPSYSFANSTSTGMYSPATNNLALAANGTASLYVIGSSGYVGIGTSSPNQALEVAGTVRSNRTAVGTNLEFTVNGTSNGAIVTSGGAGQELGLQGAQTLALWTNGTKRAHIDASGNMGIGTATPQAGLDVATSGTASAIIVPRDTQANRPSTGVNGMVRYNTDSAALEGYVAGAWQSLAGSTGSNAAFMNGGNTFGGNATLGTKDSGTVGIKTSDTVRVTVDATGRVGIGTTTPKAALDVATTGTAASAIIVPRDTTANRPTASVNGMIRYNTDSSSLESYVNGTWQMVAVGTGVGTVQAVYQGNGISMASSPLTSVGTIAVDVGTAANKIVQLNSNSQAALSNGTVALPAFAFANSPSTGIYSPSTNNLSLTASGTAALTITGSNSNVGIGTAAPAGKLHVAGKFVIDDGSNTGRMETRNGLDLYSTISGGAILATFKQGSTGASSNYVSMFNSALGAYPSIRAAGAEGSVSLELQSKGAGDILLTTNKVGIGTTTPQAALDVVGLGASYSAMIIPRDTTANRPTGVEGMIRYNTSNGNVEAYMAGGWQALATSTGVGAALLNGGNSFNVPATIGTADTYPLSIMTNNTTRMHIDTNGLIGIGTVAPQTALDIATTGDASALLVPRDSMANRPSTGINGMIRYNTSSSSLEGYISGEWKSIASGTSVGTVLGVYAGTGLTGGPVTTTGTISVNVGTGTSQIVQLNSSAQTALDNGSAAAPTYSFATSPATGIFSPSLDSLAFATGGTEYVSIASNGYMGIGTTSAAARLHVDGTIDGAGELLRLSSTGYGSLSLGTDANAPYVGSSTNNKLNLMTNSTTRMTIDESGNVGIGTTTPEAGLDIALTGPIASALIVPRDDTANRPTGVNGMIRYNTSTSALETYEAGTWKNMINNSVQGITALTGDVTASGAGSRPATVALVGGVSAANVAAGANLANAATNINTFSAIVKRDASGNFSAGTITANLAGNATNVSGTVAIANGGTGQTTKSAAFNALSPITTLGDIIYGSAANTAQRLAGNTTTTTKFLTQTGTGAVSAAPAWATIGTNDVPWATAGTIGSTTPNSATFTTLAATDAITASSTYTQTLSTDQTAMSVIADSVTTSPVASLSANGLSTGSILQLSSASGDGATGLDVVINGTNNGSAVTRAGIKSTVSNTGSSGNTNIAALLSATGASNSYALITTGGSVGIGTSAPDSLLEVNGSARMKSFSAASASTTSKDIDFSTGNSITSSVDCSAHNIDFHNLRDGGSYVLVITNTGTSTCTFNTSVQDADAATVSYRFKPANGNRTATSHTIYRLLRVGSVVYVSWESGY